MPKLNKATGGKVRISLGTPGAAEGKVNKPKKSLGTTTKLPPMPLEGAQIDVKMLEERMRQTQEQLRAVEKQIFNLETQYFEMANPQGNALKGYEGLLSSVAVSAKKAQFKNEDRIFSSSSVSGAGLQL